ncbi:MAG: zf-TFIIB domain-containing protein [Acidobacteria bacterium]|nr:zf-TFIIB domain-containing protein [Acidobacteriota bacterium]MCA1638678.1 zf-TFIIB domain-containing protein [Acidobacteriota bacterium]
MNCPSCNAQLSMTAREGVEIDYCPNCRGVWLDRGELDKIIERSAADTEYKRNDKYDEPKQYNKYDREDQHSHTNKKYKKKESFLGNLFDF